jgi:type I restriction enzyme R subunit
MWLTGFDVESLATMYIDKPMKMHTLMQTIARANRIHEGKHNGLIVDYNGMVKSLRKALAVYAVGSPHEGTPSENGDDEQDPVPPEDDLLEEYKEALQACVDHLAYLGYDLSDLIEAQGFDKLKAIEKGADAVCLNDDTRARFEVLAREGFKIGRSLIADPRIFYPPTKERHDATDAIYKQIQKSSVAEDITDILIDAYRVVDKTITVYTTDMKPGGTSGKVFDISMIDTEKLKREFSRSSRQNTAVQVLKERVEQHLERMVRRNPLRVDFAEHYQKIVDEYNYETDRATIEKTFEELINIVEDLSEEEQRAAREGLTEEYLAVFDLLCEKKNDLSTVTRNRVKAISKELIEVIKAEISKFDNWREKEATQAQVRTFIYNYLYSDTTGLPVDAYTPEDVETISGVLYQHVYEQYPSAMVNVYAATIYSEIP